jgi:hypothetical protein
VPRLTSVAARHYLSGYARAEKDDYAAFVPRNQKFIWN